MTILPKKKAGGQKNPDTESSEHGHNQSPESHDRLFVSGGGVVSADELRWTGSPRPLPPGGGVQQ